MRTSRRTGVSVGPAGMMLVAFGYLVIGTVYLAGLAVWWLARLITEGIEAIGERIERRQQARQ